MVCNENIHSIYRDLANYLVWRIMMNRASNLPQRFRDKILEYNEVRSLVTVTNVCKMIMFR